MMDVARQEMLREARSQMLRNLWQRVNDSDEALEVVNTAFVRFERSMIVRTVLPRNVRSIGTLQDWLRDDTLELIVPDELNKCVWAVQRQQEHPFGVADWLAVQYCPAGP